MATKKASSTKKAPAKKAAPANGSVQLAAYVAATAALKVSGAALIQVSKEIPGFGKQPKVRAALQAAVDVATKVKNAIPVGPPPTTVS